MSSRRIRVLVAQEQGVPGSYRDLRPALEQLASQVEVVAFVNSGAVALREAEARKPDVIISAWSLPDTNVTTLAAQLVKARSTIPLIALTTSVTPDMLVSAMANGVDGFLSLPADKDELYTTLKTTYERGKIDVRAYEAKYLGGISSVHTLVVFDCLLNYREECAALHATLNASIPAVEVASWHYTGFGALDYVRSMLPDMVLLDRRIPDMDLPKLVDAIRAEFPDLPIILMVDAADARFGGLKGITAFLEPPFDAAELTRVLRAARDG